MSITRVYIPDYELDYLESKPHRTAAAYSSTEKKYNHSEGWHEFVELASVWHDASDEPKFGMQVLGIDYDGYSGSGEFELRNVAGIFINECLILDWDSVKQWAYIRDLLPEGGEK